MLGRRLKFSFLCSDNDTDCQAGVEMDSQNHTSGGPPATESTNAAGKFVNVLVIGTDLSFAKNVQTALNSLQANHPDTSYRVFPGAQKEKILEYIEKYPLHSILVEEEAIDTALENWIKDFREVLKKTPHNKSAPIVYVTSKTDIIRAKDAVRLGYIDVIVKPLDQSLFIQKMNMYNPDIEICNELVLFSMDTRQPVDIGLYFETKTVSEYGMKIYSNRHLEPGMVVTLYTAFLGENIAAVIKEVTKIGDDKYSIFMMYIGVTPSQSQAIRKFIRANYSEEKQSA